MVSDMWSQEEAEERLRKTKFIMLTGTGGTAHPTGPHEKETRVVRRQTRGARERFRLWPLLWFLAGKARQDRVKNFRLASLNGLWAIVMAPSCLAPGPGMITEEEY